MTPTIAPKQRKPSCADFGRAVGISRQAAHKFLQDHHHGAPPATKDEFVLIYCEHIRRVAAGYQSASGELDLTYERARLAKAQADAKEMENQVRRGELAEISEVTASWSKLIYAARARLLALPHRCAPLMLHHKTPGAPYEILHKSVNEALTELSQRGGNDDDTEISDEG